MRVIELKDTVQKQAILPEEAFFKLEKEQSTEPAFWVMSPDKAEAICFEPKEAEDLIAELSGKVSLDYLAEHLNLTAYQTHFVLKHLQKIGKINGELTYTAFTSNRSSKLRLLQEAKEHKQGHRRKMREKR